jgi:hypothetical protein
MSRCGIDPPELFHGPYIVGRDFVAVTAVVLISQPGAA